MWKRLLNWLLERGREKSTWVGIVGVIATAAGWRLDPELAREIATAAVTLMGGLLMLVKEEKKSK
ncbi:hypothetical protein [Methylohalobius crimeensis]|uniref:hypothetical protein n=1 Tax=Methylohalobius crimeensis TaxID=244365 RepID=UPI0003B69879|nr:hypothetical protein [Methylohalobius crimeensis]